MNDLRSVFRWQLVLSAAAFSAIGFANLTQAQAPELESRLNERVFEGVTDVNCSAKTIFDAYAELSAPPVPVGGDFNLTTIWAGMPGFDAVANWAAANEHMGQAIFDAEDMIVLGMPYGRDEVSPAWRSANIMIDIAPGGDITTIEYPYLDAMDTVAAWATAEMYRLLEAGKYSEAFDLAVAFLRVLRQGCEQEMLEEKVWYMETLSDALSTHRDAMQSYLGKIPAQVLRDLGTREYPFLKPTDNERMKRLEMPEGDRLLAEAVLDAAFDRSGQPNAEQFADVFGILQASGEPLARFGTRRRWMRLSAMHASKDASLEKLTDVYDDWWRRWRMRQHDEGIAATPTEISRLNKVRFASVDLLVRDIDEAFQARERLITNINGTMLAAGLCASRETFKAWPNSLSPIYSVYVIKRFDFDPYNSNYGGFKYRKLNKRRALDSPYGRVWADGALLYALGRDHTDDGASETSNDGASGELVIWPPVRQLARDEKLID